MHIIIVICLSGFLAVPAAVLGQVVSGLIIRKFNFKVRDIIKFNLGCSVVVVLFASAFWAKCDQNNIAGLTSPYSSSDFR